LLKREYLPFPDIGFAILPEFERNGYVFEVSQALLANVTFSEIQVITTKENKSSLFSLEIRLSFY
jgi:ribosomal-protein-alanine N-acetyltransferase